MWVIEYIDGCPFFRYFSVILTGDTAGALECTYEGETRHDKRSAELDALMYHSEIVHDMDAVALQ